MNGQIEEHYYSYSRYLKETFGSKTYKVVVASGLTCPTRDGSLAKRGCAFCDLRGSSSFFGKQGRGLPVHDQIEKRLPGIRERFGAEKFLAYFQSYTNTYSDTEYLRRIYLEALNHPDIHGLCIGTRPDCLPDRVIELLEELAQEHYISLELGVQSFEDQTLEWLDRGHDRNASIQALEKLRSMAPHVQTCVHLMFGSPTDSPRMAAEAASILNQYEVRGVKLHQVMVLEHTVLAERYRESEFPIISLEDYSQLIETFVTNLSPKVYIERLYAIATHREECIGPEWSKHRWIAHNYIRDRFSSREVRQGMLTESELPRALPTRVSPNEGDVHPQGERLQN